MTRTRLANVVGLIGLLLFARPVSAQPTPANKLVFTGSLPATIPIFPLGEAMLFPNVSRPLLIFEPRYRAMVADALRGDRIIGMVTLLPGFEADYEGRPPIYPIGCAGAIASAEELPDGRYIITLRGLVKFRVMSENASRVYRLAAVQAIPEVLNNEQRAALRKERQRLEARLESIAPGSTRSLATLPDDEVVNTLAQSMPLDPLDRQDLLEQDDALGRMRALIGLLPGK